MKRALLTLGLKLDLQSAPIEGPMRDHLYPPQSKAQPREMSERERRIPLRLDCEAAKRSRQSTSDYMSHCEVTSLLIASKSGDILR